MSAYSRRVLFLHFRLGYIARVAEDKSFWGLKMLP